MNWQDNKTMKDSWFFKWFLNNQATIAILLLFLIFLTLYLFTKISFIFTPVLLFSGIVMLPVVISTILYYLLKPFVTYLEKLGMSSVTAIVLAFAAILILLIWAISSIVPTIEFQLTSFVVNLPAYVRATYREANQFLQSPWLDHYQATLENFLDNINNKAGDYAANISKNALEWASTFAGTIARVTVALIISPFILFYLLRDSHKMKAGFLTVVPTKLRSSISRVLGDINKQLSGYVQGQVIVAISVSIMFSLFFSIVGLRYAVTFGIFAGLFNLVPHLGSLLILIPALMVSSIQEPMILVQVIIVFLVEHIIEGRILSPLILGNKLHIHTLTIMLIILVAGEMFGIWGIFFAIPIYASLKVIIREIFTWYKQISGLYNDSSEETSTRRIG